jgi:hypothetical protein
MKLISTYVAHLTSYLIGGQKAKGCIDGIWFAFSYIYICVWNFPNDPTFVLARGKLQTAVAALTIFGEESGGCSKLRAEA